MRLCLAQVSPILCPNLFNISNSDLIDGLAQQKDIQMLFCVSIKWDKVVDVCVGWTAHADVLWLEQAVCVQLQPLVDCYVPKDHLEWCNVRQLPAPAVPDKDTAKRDESRTTRSAAGLCGVWN